MLISLKFEYASNVIKLNSRISSEKKAICVVFKEVKLETNKKYRKKKENELEFIIHLNKNCHTISFQLLFGYAIKMFLVRDYIF